jgi:hypothetical protein
VMMMMMMMMKMMKKMMMMMMMMMCMMIEIKDSKVQTLSYFRDLANPKSFFFELYFCKKSIMPMKYISFCELED